MTKRGTTKLASKTKRKGAPMTAEDVAKLSSGAKELEGRNPGSEAQPKESNTEKGSEQAQSTKQTKPPVASKPSRETEILEDRVSRKNYPLEEFLMRKAGKKAGQVYCSENNKMRLSSAAQTLNITSTDLLENIIDDFFDNYGGKLKELYSEKNVF